MSKIILEKNNQNKLPKGWVITNLDAISDTILGQSPPSSTYNNQKNGLPFFQGKGDFGAMYPKTRFWCNSPKKIAEKGDVLISVRAPVGPVNISLEKCCIGRGLAAIRTFEGIDPMFIFYQIKSLQNIIAEKGTGTTFDAITGTQLRSIQLKISSINEQKRIVSKIEDLFSLIDFQLITLKQTKLLLNNLKKSLLLNAFKGKITQEWRKEKQIPIESARNLLDIIKNERDKAKNSYHQYDKITRDTLQLPDSWEISSLGWVCRNHDGDRIPVSSEKRIGIKGKYPYYGASGIIDYVNRPIFKGKYLLIGEDGANLLSRSTPIAFIAEGEFWVNNHAHVLTTYGGITLEFLSFYINSLDLSPWVSGTAQPKLNQANMNKIPIPIPSLEEQSQIVRILEFNFSIIENTMKYINELISMSEKAHHSILNISFKGELVTQDPNDESVSILLEKIKQEKQTIISQAQKTRGRKNVK